MFETTSLQREILILVFDSWNSVKWCMNYTEKRNWTMIQAITIHTTLVGYMVTPGTEQISLTYVLGNSNIDIVPM
jgi:hypothetical protein